jgi:hypothetical protein
MQRRLDWAPTGANQYRRGYDVDHTTGAVSPLTRTRVFTHSVSVNDHAGIYY